CQEPKAARINAKNAKPPKQNAGTGAPKYAPGLRILGWRRRGNKDSPDRGPRRVHAFRAWRGGRLILGCDFEAWEIQIQKQIPTLLPQAGAHPAMAGEVPSNRIGWLYPSPGRFFVGFRLPFGFEVA